MSQLPEEPLYGNEDWQQQMDDEQRRAEEEALYESSCRVSRATCALATKTTIRAATGADWPAYDARMDTAPDGRPLHIGTHTYESWCKPKGQKV